MFKIRAHHLVCLCYFIGKGYDSSFVVNMKRILNFLEKNSFLRCLKIVDGFDDVCLFCPKKVANSKIVDGVEACFANSCSKLDKSYSKFFKINESNCLALSEVLQLEKKFVSDSEFFRICKSCGWFNLCVSVRKKQRRY